LTLGDLGGWHTYKPNPKTLERAWPFETIVMAIVLEQQEQLTRLERMLDEFQAHSQT
jgi:hypothetical protein